MNTPTTKTTKIPAGWFAPEGNQAPDVGQQVLFLLANGQQTIGHRTTPIEHWNYRKEPDQKVIAWLPLEATAN